MNAHGSDEVKSRAGSYNDRSGILPVCRPIKALAKILRLDADVRSWGKGIGRPIPTCSFSQYPRAPHKSRRPRKSEISPYLPVRSDEERDP